jgi:hypothetical protein
MNFVLVGFDSISRAVGFHENNTIINELVLADRLEYYTRFRGEETVF